MKRQILIAVIALIVGFGAGYGSHLYMVKDWAETGTSPIETDSIGDVSFDVGLGHYRHYDNGTGDTITGDDNGKETAIAKTYYDFHALTYLQVERTLASDKMLEHAMKRYADKEIKVNGEIPDCVDKVFCWQSNPLYDDEGNATLYMGTSAVVRIGDYDFQIRIPQDSSREEILTVIKSMTVGK